MSTYAHVHARARTHTHTQTEALYLMFTNLTIMLSREKTECIQTTYRDNRKYQHATAFKVTINIFLTDM
jgi:hypothetical protein